MRVCALLPQPVFVSNPAAQPPERARTRPAGVQHAHDALFCRSLLARVHLMHRLFLDKSVCAGAGVQHAHYARARPAVREGHGHRVQQPVPRLHRRDGPLPQPRQALPEALPRLPEEHHAGAPPAPLRLVSARCLGRVPNALIRLPRNTCSNLHRLRSEQVQACKAICYASMAQ